MTTVQSEQGGLVDGTGRTSTPASTPTSGASERRSRFVITSVKAKDDTCTRTRVRHPTDRGNCPAAAALSPTLFEGGAGDVFLEDGVEARSRAYTYAVPGRMNVYKRGDGSTWNSRKSNSEEKNPSVKNSAGPDGPTESPKTPVKRGSWLQRSWRSAAHSSGKQFGSALTVQTSPVQEPLPELLIRKPIVTSSGLSGFLDRWRPRSSSDASSNGLAAQQVLISRRKKGAVTSSVDSVRRYGSETDQRDEGIDQCSPLVRQSPQSNGPLDKSSRRGSETLELESWFEEDMFDSNSTGIRRKRSNSDATNFLILRKTSRPNAAEVLGSLGRHDDAYKQLLTKFTCYDLMPAQGAFVVIDSQLPTRQALSSLAENGVRAAVLWDSRQSSAVCLITVTDLLRIMVAYFAHPMPKTPTSSAKGLSPNSNDQIIKGADLTDILRQPILSNLIKAGSVKPTKGSRRGIPISVGTDDTLRVAALAMRLNRLHRVLVSDVDMANPLYLLSSRKLFHFLYNHMTNLPLPSAVYKSLDELRLGTWTDTHTIASVTLENSLMEAAEKFLDAGVSSLPVLETCMNTNTDTGTGADSVSNGHCQPMEIDSNCTCKPNRLIDSLTKVDLMHFILVNGWNDLQSKAVKDVILARHQNMEKLVACHRKMPLNLAIDRMIQSNAHRIYIVDSSGVLEGVLSVGDLLSYLLD